MTSDGLNFNGVSLFIMGNGIKLMVRMYPNGKPVNHKGYHNAVDEVQNSRAYLL